MNSPLILVLSGWSHSGKDAVAKILVESYGFTRLAFADVLKMEVSDNLNIPLEWCHNHSKKSELIDGTNISLRQHLINYANDKRKEDSVYWAKQIAKLIRKSSINKYIISDWRMLDEFLHIQKEFPKSHIIPLRIVRPSQIISPVPDITEYSLLGFPFYRILTNKEGLTNLINEVSSFIEDNLDSLLS